MKKILILLLSFAVFSCNKKDVEPELSAQIEGTYNVFHLEFFGDVLKLPSSGVSMTVQILTVSANKSNYIMILKDGSDKSTESGTFDLKKNGDDIELYEDNEKVGFVRGTIFEYNLDDEVVIKGNR